MKWIFNRLFFFSLIFLLLPDARAQDTAVVNNLNRKLQKYEADKVRRHAKEIIPQDTTKIRLLYSLGRAYWSSIPDKSIALARQIEKLSKQLNFKKGLGLAYNLSAIAYWCQANHLNALDELQKGLKVAEEEGNKTAISTQYMNMGGVYSEMGNNSEALKNHLKSLKIDLETGNKKRIALSRIYLGVVYMKVGSYNEALEQFNSALIICNELDMKVAMSESLENIASIYEKQGKYEEARLNNLKAIKILESFEDKSLVCHSYSSLGMIYFKLKEIDKAIRFEHKALGIAKTVGAFQMESECYRNLSQFYAAKKNFAKAFDFSVLYKKSEDSLFNIEKNNKVTELKMRYEFDKKESALKAEQDKKDKISEAAMLAHTNERKLYIALGIFLLLTVLALWSRLNLTRKTKKLLEEKNEQIRAEKEIAEQQRVRAKLMDMRHEIAKDLHDDIGSSLSSISIYSEVALRITAEKVPEAGKILTNVSEIAQEAMENMNDIVWAINPVNDKLDDLMRRLQLLSGHLKEVRNITVHFDVADSVKKLSLTMHQRKNIYLIFKEAINNIAKYSGASNCFVLIKKQEETILISIKDDGAGFDDKAKGMGGNGLINMHQRALEMSGVLSVVTGKDKGTELNFSFKS